MLHIKVLGPGCSNCTTTAKRIEQVAKELEIEIQLEKVTDLAAIMGFGALATPGVVIDERLVHSGGVPNTAQIKAWIAG